MKHRIHCAALALALCAAGALAAMPDNDFIALCKAATPDEVRRALQDGANPNARQRDDGPWYSPLMRAALNPNPEVVGVLLAAGADVNGTDEDGRTALMEAASSNANIDVLRALLAAGAKVDARGFFGITPLMRATANKNPEALRALIAAGADVNARDDGGETALMKAAAEGVEGVRALLAAGADVSARTKDGETALMRAAAGGAADAVRALLAAGANPALKDKRGHDALWHAKHADHRFVTDEQTAEVVHALQKAPQGGAKKPAAAQGAAALRVYVADPSGTATNVRAAPGGAVAGTLAVEHDYFVTLAGCEKGWCRASAIETVEGEPVALAKGGERWLHSSVLAFSTRNYGYQKLALRAEPDEKSAPAFSFTDERALRPLDVRAGWVLAETLDKKHRGWLQTEWVCGNPVTTCP